MEDFISGKHLHLALSKIFQFRRNVYPESNNYSGSKWPLCKSCRNLQVRVLIISRDLDTDLSLVESGHVTWKLASDWSGANNLISQHYVAKMGNVLMSSPRCGQLTMMYV